MSLMRCVGVGNGRHFKQVKLVVNGRKQSEQVRARNWVKPMKKLSR
jgi:hypothetical protein